MIKKEWQAALCFLAAGVVAALTYPRLPQSVPVHWGIDGVANGFAGKEALLIMPLVTLLVVGAIALAIRFDPKQKNIVRSRDAVSMVLAALALILGAAQLAIVRSGFGATDRLDSIVLVLLGLLFRYNVPRIAARKRQRAEVGAFMEYSLRLENLAVEHPGAAHAADAALPPQYQMEPSACHVITCKTCQWLDPTNTLLAS